MNPKPFASLNHFTVPVAISSNSSSTRYKRDVARPMFRSQGKYGGRTTAWRSYRACLYCLEQNTADTIRQISRKSDRFPAAGLAGVARNPAPDVGFGKVPGGGAGGVRTSIPAGRLRRRRRVLPACGEPRRAEAEPCRSSCTAGGEPRERTLGPSE